MAIEGTRRPTDDPNAGAIDPPQKKVVSQRFIQGTAEQKQADTSPKWSEVISPFTEAVSNMAQKADTSAKEARVNARVAQLGGDVAVDDIKGTEQRTGMFGAMFGQSITRRAVQQKQISNDMFKDTLNESVNMDMLKSMSPEAYAKTRQDKLMAMRDKYKGDRESQDFLTQKFNEDTFKLAQQHRKSYETEVVVQAQNETKINSELILDQLAIDNAEFVGEDKTMLQQAAVRQFKEVWHPSLSPSVLLGLNEGALIKAIRNDDISMLEALRKQDPAYLEQMDSKKISEAESGFHTRHAASQDAIVYDYGFEMKNQDMTLAPDVAVAQVHQKFGVALEALQQGYLDTNDATRSVKDFGKDKEELINRRNAQLARIKALKETASKASASAQMKATLIAGARDQILAVVKGDNKGPVNSRTYEDADGNKLVVSQSQYTIALDSLLREEIAKEVPGGEDMSDEQLAGVLGSHPNLLQKLDPFIQQGHKSEIVQRLVRGQIHGFTTNKNPDDDGVSEETRLIVRNLEPQIAKGIPGISSDEQAQMQMLSLGTRSNKTRQEIKEWMTLYNKHKSDPNWVPSKDYANRDHQLTKTIEKMFPNMGKADMREFKRHHALFYDITGNKVEADEHLRALLENGYSVQGNNMLVLGGLEMPTWTGLDNSGGRQVYGVWDALTQLNKTGDFAKLVRDTTGSLKDQNGDLVNLDNLQDPTFEYNSNAQVYSVRSRSFGSAPVNIPVAVMDMYMQRAMDKGLLDQGRKAVEMQAIALSQIETSPEVVQAEGFLGGLFKNLYPEKDKPLDKQNAEAAKTTAIHRNEAVK